MARILLARLLLSSFPRPLFLRLEISTDFSFFLSLSPPSPLFSFLSPPPRINLAFLPSTEGANKKREGDEEGAQESGRSRAGRRKPASSNARPTSSASAKTTVGMGGGQSGPPLGFRVSGTAADENTRNEDLERECHMSKKVDSWRLKWPLKIPRFLHRYIPFSSRALGPSFIVSINFTRRSIKGTHKIFLPVSLLFSHDNNNALLVVKKERKRN